MHLQSKKRAATSSRLVDCRRRSICTKCKQGGSVRFNSSPSQRRQSGFTLLELICSIVIIGVLSATALPTVVGLASEARVAVVKNMEGAIRSASALMHMKCIVDQACASTVSEFMLKTEGEVVRLAKGYPSPGSPDGIALALEFSGFTPMHSQGRTVFAKDGATDAMACAVVYEGAGADGQAPSINALTSGC